MPLSADSGAGFVPARGWMRICFLEAIGSVVVKYRMGWYPQSMPCAGVYKAKSFPRTARVLSEL